ncbi:hypothetical protein NQ317_003739 [Molorchus minor]|uniref:C2H2-type domain-containing protein n=1 Tax=Molorchus minor TaxID=1323400 RepID=A0ABQ9JQU5_9CUCU|nr:hypothetical protein NQ317_003739 [Molorchus minor]
MVESFIKYSERLNSRHFNSYCKDSDLPPRDLWVPLYTRKALFYFHLCRYSREEYRCESCPYICTTEKAFLKHLRRCTISKNSSDSDPQNSPLSCPVCGKDRRNESSLSVHMVKHKAGKYFCCDLCKFKSVQLKKVIKVFGIIQHRRMHTGEKPHLCPHCSYRSSRRDNLRSHVRRMHNEDDLHCDTFTPRKILLIPNSKTS